jgi:hypothetical protein
MNTVILLLILLVLVWQTIQPKNGRFQPNPGDEASAIDTKTGRYCLAIQSSGPKAQSVPYCWELR